MPTYLSDEEMFGAGKTAPTYLSDEEMFGAPAEAPKKKKPASSGVVDTIADLGLSIWEGTKNTARSIGAAGNTVTGDLADVEGYAADNKAAAENGPQAKRDLLTEIERRKQADKDPGVLSAVKNVGASMLSNPEGSAQFIAEQAPNSAVALGSGYAGAKLGAAIGTAIVPGLGTVAGGTLGFLGGMFLGNSLLETGGKAMEKADGGFTESERGDALREGATKGAVITGVDALTLGVGGKVAKTLNKAAIEAGARAEARVLADAGIDVTSRAAVEQALVDPALRETAKIAGQTAAKGATTIGSKAASVGTGLTMETVGEGTGEYLGELAATGKADVYDAVMEAAAGFTQSVPETAWNIRNASGNDLNSRNITRLGPDDAAPAAKPASQGGAPINASEVLGATSQANKSGSVGTTDTTQADKALLTPIGSNDLDRVTEINQKIAASTDAAEIATLSEERAALSKNWPTAIPGNAASFSTESGLQLEGQYALIDADQLVTSHDENLRANPAYPAELQPRERERAASEMQVSGIVQKLNPARLGVSADSATGAPIVGADGLVESGNARTIALKRIYQANGQKAIDYKQFLADNAAQFGITPESVQGMTKPVLVRIRSTPVNRAEFARQANAPTVAQMSPSEQAKSDSKRITSMDDLNPDDNGDFGTSRDFIRRFLAGLPQTEQGAMIDADGKLSTAGYSRISNAILAKAYGDSPVLTRMVESRDDNLRNVSKALLLAAPTVAKMREAISQGNRFDADITPDLMAAVEELSSLKDSGTSLQDALAQAGMFGEKYSVETKQLLQFLADNIRRPRKMAEFITNYMDALDAAGDPNQGSLLGDVEAPSKSDLLNAVRKGLDQNGTQDLRADTTQNTKRGKPGESAPTGSADRGQPTDAPGNRGGNEGDGATGSGGQAQSVEKSEWVNFPKDSGTIGIPRADMPQIKGDHRGALLQFLKARGIDNETKENVPASEFKPTQAEFSIKKTANWAEIRDGSDRSVLVSSDGYILDGHHQWMAAVSAKEPVKAIVLDSPIRELLTAVFQFPSVQQSQDSAKTDDKRTKARDDFKAAMADLADLMADKIGARLMMVKPGDVDVQKILSRLFAAAIEIVGTDLKAATKWVKEKLKSDPKTKSWWNKITDKDYQTAALTALESGAKQKVDDLFAKAEKAQSSLFDNAPAAPKVAMIKGRAYDYAEKTGDNFKIPAPSSFLSAEILTAADAFVKKYYTKAEHPMTKEERAQAEKLMAPYVAKAQESKAEYDQKIIDIAQRTKALGQLLAPIKSLKRGAEKMWDDARDDGRAMDAADIKDFLRSTIVVSSYADVPAIVDAIRKEFNVVKEKDKTLESVRAIQGGYADYTVIVKMENGALAEIQINVPAMLSAKENQGHKLYEAARSLERSSPLKTEISNAMRVIYDFAFAGELSSLDRAKQATNAASEAGAPLRGPAASMPGKAMSDAPSSDALNQPAPGMETYSSPEKLKTNSQPGGKTDGTFIESPFTSNVAPLPEKGYTNTDLFGNYDANSQPSNESAQGKSAGTAQATDGAGKSKRVRQQPGQSDQLGVVGGDDAGSNDTQVGQARADRVRQENADGRRAKPRSGDSKSVGIPAGRDVPAKSGLNYEFGPDDLTYTGNWRVKAEQNIAAIELLRKLESEKRQATRAEQAILAKFNGFGAGEIANNLFGPKLDKVAAAAKSYETLQESLAEIEKKYKRDYLKKGGLYRGDYGDNGYYAAVQALRDAEKISRFENPSEVTRADIEALKPSTSDLRWLKLREQLKGLLSKEEWAEASRSTQYAHYTSKAVVQSIWSAVDRMGFKGGSILEPGAGIGVFPGLMPQSMANTSSYTGIEFESVTGGILKQLFPDERILVESFVDSKLPKNFYDVAVGNPPFSSIKVLGDPEYAKSAFSLHDYFFAKSIDRVKPGGLVVYITSRYTMDKLDDKARKYLSDRADLVGAIRLPQTAFKENAGTDVVTDVIFLRKKIEGETFEGAQAWSKSIPMKVGGKEFPLNEYFHAHPEMVLGKHSDTGKMQNTDEPQYTVLPLEGDIEAHFAKATESLPKDIYTAARGSTAEAAKVREIDFNPKAQKEGNYYVTDAGVLMVREGGVGQRVERVNEKDTQMLKDFVPLRDALKQAHYDQLSGGQWEGSLAALNKAYDSFVKKHGQINQFTTRTVETKVEDEDTGETFLDENEIRVFTLHNKMRDDPDWTSVIALEEVNDDTGKITKSAFLNERVLGKPTDAKIDTPSDALLSSLNDIGRVDISLIAKRLGISEVDTVLALGSSIYNDPESGWTTSDEYLSGNVKAKLENARTAAKSDKNFERNITALESVQPIPKTPSEINISIGMNWVPGKVYSQFLYQTTGVKARIEFNQATKQWIVKELEGGKSAKATADWGTERRNATELMEAALTGRNIRIDSTVGSGKDAKKAFDADATEAANQKLTQLKEAFQNWVWEDSGRTDLLVRNFNDKFNTTVPRSFDGRHLTLPGMSQKWTVFDHVKRGAWRIIQRGNTYLAHAVGSGKTFQMVISAMEQKRLGMIKKPMMVVPNHMLAQFAREWKDLYPAARLMVADENNFHMDNRRRFVSRVALSDLDGVIITQSAFKLLDLDPVFKKKMIDEQLTFMRAALEEAGGDPDKLEFETVMQKNGKEKLQLKKGSEKKDPKIKQIEKQIENMEQKLLLATSSVGKDTNVRFDELGVDFMYVDEAHEYRKLDFQTTRQVKGVNPIGSGKAFDLYMKSRYLEEKTPGRSLVMASGTPVTNTMAELYTVQRFMDNKALVDRGIEDFDSWASMFGREKTALEPNAAGKYEPVTRFNKFVNVPELTQMFREYADVLNSDHLAMMLGDKRPKVEGGSRKILITPTTQGYKEFKDELTKRVEKSKEWKPTADEPNNPDPIIRIIGDGRLAAIDTRFVDPTQPSDPDSKLNQMIDGVIAVHKKYADTQYKTKSGELEPTKGSVQMVFSDLGFGADVAENRGFNARAWFEKRLRDSGVNMNEVAFMSDYKKSSAKLKLFNDVNAGRIRILVGSSKNMGTGVNAQQRLIALHHLDSPWFPSDLEQREGRIVRQGNKNPLVQIYAYAAKGTYDENMWKLLASKQYFIDQALSGDANVREVEDLDSQSQYDLVAAMAADDPRVLQLAGARAEIEKMQRLYRAHESQRQRFRQEYTIASDTIAYNEKMLPKADAQAKKVIDLSGDKFTATAGGKTYTVRAEWAQAMLDKMAALTAKAEMQTQTVGEISGFKVAFFAENTMSGYSSRIDMEFPGSDSITLAMDQTANPAGMAIRATNMLNDIRTLPGKMRQRISDFRSQIDAIAGRLDTPFTMQQMLSDKIAEANEIEADILADSKAAEVGPDNAQEDLANTETRLSRAEGASATKTGMDYQELVTLVDGIKAKMPNMPKVHVLADPGTAPKALKDYITKQGAWSDVEGAFHNGELYMFANGLSDPLRAEHVLAEHEAAHYGLRAVLGNDVTKVMQMLYNNNPRLRKAAAELQALGDLSIAEAVEEVIVDIPSAELAKLSGWRKLVIKVRDYLQERGYTNLAAEITRFLNATLGSQQRADLMVADLVRLARGFVAGNTPLMQTPDMQASRLASSLADDAAKQEKWLTKEAKARGYADIDTLAEKDYPLFEKLAKMWREANPAENGVLLSRGSGGDQTDTPAFKKWFGDSKVVGRDGKPMVLYHGTDSEDNFNEFDTMDYGSWFAESRKTSEAYEAKNGDIENSRIYSVYLKAEKPFYISRDFDMSDDHRVQDLLDAVNADNGTDITAKEIAFDPDDTNTAAYYIGFNDRFIDAVKKAGFDSINGYEQGDSTWCVFNPTQVKSATNNNGDFDGTNPDIRLSRTQGQAAPAKDVADRAEAIIQKSGSTIRPMDAAAQLLTRATGIQATTTFVYNGAAKLLDRWTPETVKAGIVSDYGVPQAVIDRRAIMQGNQRKELTKAGSLLEKLATLTRDESRVAYEWMNMDGSDPKAYMSMMQGLPEESVKVLTEVQKMIDELSQEAMRLGQLSPEAYKRNRMAYLRRSYVKHTAELTKGEAGKKARAISILGDQYKGRGMVDAVPMEKVQKDSTDWWKSKLQAGKADAALKGERFVRLERRAPSGEGTKSIDGMESKKPGKLLETAYIAVSEPIPAKYKEWSRNGVWEVRDVKGPNLVMWRDFTKDEREKMGEIDEARYSIAKTLHGMIHDVEVGRYLEWLGQTYGKLDGDAIPGTVIEASERMRDVFAPDEWVQVPTTKIPGTQVTKYGSLAGKYIPGPIWNDLRQVVNGQFKPLGESYATLLSFWKTSKTALSIGVHTNNIMSNFVMADWHDVSAGHMAKALRIILAASQGTDRKGLGGMALRTGSKIGIADAEAAREILNRYKDSGGDIGSWVTSEIKSEQLAPLLEQLEKELTLTAGNSMSAQVGVMAALQHALKLRFPSAWDALKMGKRSGAVVKAVANEGNNLIDLYQSEDDVFRLAAWLKTKEQGGSDSEAGKVSRTSFLDYRVNAPWIQAMRTTGWPFVSFSYRAIPMLAEIAGKKPHKIMKLMLLAGAVNAFGVMMAGGDDDEERKLLPEEKAGGIWGMVPKLVRMPWNDNHNSPVYLDIRRFIPVGDFLDVGQSNAAIPLFPFLQPGGPLMLLGEVVLNKSAFTGKAITQETDTFGQSTTKVLDYLYKAFAPNLLGLPGSYASTGVMDAMKGRTDAFGREMSVPQALAASFGIKVGSYPADVMRRNLTGKAQAELMEIDKNIMGLKRQRQTNRISDAEYRDAVMVEQEKKVKLIEKLREKL